MATIARPLRLGRILPRAQLACLRCRFYATPAESAAPALLVKLRKDLKTAMKEKDTDRLNVLRSILAEVTNAAKTQSPIRSDMQVVSLLRKRAAAAKSAGDEFESAGRQDLVDQELKQAEIMEEYAGTVETMTTDDMRNAVGKVVEEVKAVATGKINMGDVLKKLLGPGGSLEGKSVERSEVARTVKQVLGQS